MAKFSIIVPAYNCADTIENTINSLFASGLPDFEIIIIDDGSNDGTGRICDTLAEKFEYIRCIHQENSGVSAARNRGIREATGEYIWLFDADDSVDENALCQIAETINDYAPDMFIFGVEFDYYHKGNIYRRDEALPPTEGMKNREECSNMLYELFVSNSLSSLCSRVIKRSVITDADISLREDMFLYEDLEFSLRVLAQCGNIFFLREAIYKYRQSEDEGSAGRRLKRVPHIPELVDKIEEALDVFDGEHQSILLSLYLVLAREKIAVSTKEEIDVICRDFKGWIDGHELFDLIADKEYPLMIYEGKLSELIRKRRHTKIRHSTANWIKRNFGDFRK